MISLLTTYVKHFLKICDTTPYVCSQYSAALAPRSAECPGPRTEVPMVRTVWTLGPKCLSAEGQFGTGAELSRVRTALGRTCQHGVVSVSRVSSAAVERSLRCNSAPQTSQTTDSDYDIFASKLYCKVDSKFYPQRKEYDQSTR